MSSSEISRISVSIPARPFVAKVSVAHDGAAAPRVIDAADLDVALDWSQKAAAACEGPLELRPMQAE